MVEPRDRKNSLRIFIALIVTLTVLAGVSLFLPQAETGIALPTATLPAAVPILALANAAVVLVVYGALGFVGLVLARRLALPEIWDPAISARQRFVFPALVGLALGVVFIVADILVSPINGIGRFPHPPFPTSVVASITAAIGEEIIFRLFFISFWTWIVSRLILRGRGQQPVYWIIATLSAIAFALGHLPSVMFLYGWTDPAQMPAILLAELIVLNGALGLAAAALFKRVGFLGAVGVHFWADVMWHVLWGAM